MAEEQFHNRISRDLGEMTAEIKGLTKEVSGLTTHVKTQNGRIDKVEKRLWILAAIVALILLGKEAIIPIVVKFLL